ITSPEGVVKVRAGGPPGLAPIWVGPRGGSAPRAGGLLPNVRPGCVAGVDWGLPRYTGTLLGCAWRVCGGCAGAPGRGVAPGARLRGGSGLGVAAVYRHAVGLRLARLRRLRGSPGARLRLGIRMHRLGVVGRGSVATLRPRVLLYGRRRMLHWRRALL